MVVGATDIMASVLLKPVGEMGFDIAVGSAQVRMYTSQVLSTPLCMYVCVCVCMYVCILCGRDGLRHRRGQRAGAARFRVCVCLYVFVCVYIYMCVFMYVYVSVFVYVCVCI